MTFTWVAATPARSTGVASICQPPTGIRWQTLRTSSRSAPASTSAPSAMSPAMPEKQWNHAMRVTTASLLQQTEHRARGTESVVDADDRDAGGTRRQHGQQ